MAPKALASATSSPVTAGAFQDPIGNVISLGSIALDLSNPALVSGGGEVAPLRAVIRLDSNGKVAANQVIYGNDQLTPSGTFYRMTVYNSIGNFVGDFGPQSLTGAAPIDLALLTPATFPSGSISLANPALLSPVSQQTITLTTLDGAGSGNNVTLLNSQNILSNLVGNGTDQIVYTYTIPANTVGAGKGIKLHFQATNNSATAVTYKFILGSSTLLTKTTAATNAATHRFHFDIYNNAGVQNTQTITILGFDGTTITTSSSVISLENFANALVLQATANETASNSISPIKWTVELSQ